jgi:hypothetical protein
MPSESGSPSPPPAKPPDDIAKIHPIVEFLWKEWRVIKSPSFYIAVGIVAIALYWLEEKHYGGTLSEKDATIQALQTRTETLIGVNAVNGINGANPSKKVNVEKPLPDNIFPRPEQPPTPPSQQFAFVANPIIFVTNAQPVIFKADTTTNRNARATIDERMADLQAEADQVAAQEAAKFEFEKQQKLLEIPRDWGNGLDHYRRLLVVLHDDLSKKVEGTGDVISPSQGYYQCMPSNIDPGTGEIKAATIGLQINTNVNFQIKISELNWLGHRQVYVSCAAGNLELYPGTNDDFYAILNTYLGLPSPGYTTIDKADDLVSDNLTSLIAAQYLLLRQTNKK